MVGALRASHQGLSETACGSIQTRKRQSKLLAVIETLIGFYGKPAKPKLKDPFEMILWELSAELATDENAPRLSMP